MSRKRPHSSRRGATLVEFAFIAMALMMMVFGGFEFSRMALVYTAVANSAKAGVRYAIVHGADRAAGSGTDGQSGAVDSSQVVTVVSNFASAGVLNTSNLTVLVQYPAATPGSPNGNSIGSTVIVKVSYPYDPFFSIMPLRVPLSSEARGIIVF